MQQKKTKIGLSMSNELLRLEEEHRSALGFSSRSELFEVAVYDYISRKSVARFADTAAAVYEHIDGQAIASLETRMSKLMFKIAIELAQNNLLMGKAFNLDKSDLYDLRKYAYRLVKESHGMVSISKAVEHSKYLELSFDKSPPSDFDDGYDF